MFDARSALVHASWPHRLRPGLTRAIIVVMTLWLAACATDDGRTLQPPSNKTTTTVSATTVPTTQPEQAGSNQAEGGGSSTPAVFSFSSSAMHNNQLADPRFSCEGNGVSPPLAWSGVPEGTVELAVTAVDQDAQPQVFVHWALAGIAPTSQSIGEGSVPLGVTAASNSSGKPGWQPLCPPSGTTHHYLFTLFALKAPSGIAAGAPADATVDRLNQSGAPAASFTVLYHRL